MSNRTQKPLMIAAGLTVALMVLVFIAGWLLGRAGGKETPGVGMEDEVLAAMRTIPGREGIEALDEVERLGGLTNRVYRVRGGGADPVVLRIPGEGTEAYIDRTVEAVNARAAARAGVSPEVLHVDPPRGLMLTRHVEGVTMTPERFRATPGAAGRAARAFRARYSVRAVDGAGEGWLGSQYLRGTRHAPLAPPPTQSDEPPAPADPYGRRFGQR